jgi:hypothetical protein
VARLTADLAAGRSSGGGGGCSMTGSASSMAGFWNILMWLSVPAFVLARRIRKNKNPWVPSGGPLIKSFVNADVDPFTSEKPEKSLEEYYDFTCLPS